MERAGLTQEQLAMRLGVTLRTVGNWERGATVPRNREAMVREVLNIRDDRSVDPLAAASDVALLAELARRLDRARGQGEDREPAPMTVHGTRNPDGSLEATVRPARKTPPVRPSP